MTERSNRPRIPLPKGWPQRVRSALLHVMSLAQYAAVYTHSWAAPSIRCGSGIAWTTQLIQPICGALSGHRY